MASHNLRLCPRSFLPALGTNLAAPMAQASFDVAAWLARKPGSSCGAMHVSQPVQLAWWTKAGGGGGVRYGDASGACLPSCVFGAPWPRSAGWRWLQRGPASKRFGPADHQPAAHGCFPPAGLLPYAPPPLPAPLEGPYVPKPPGQDVGVEAVLRAAAAAAGGAPLAACDVLTFRNNLNKCGLVGLGGVGQLRAGVHRHPSGLLGCTVVVGALLPSPLRCPCKRHAAPPPLQNLRHALRPQGRLDGGRLPAAGTTSRR